MIVFPFACGADAERADLGDGGDDPVVLLGGKGAGLSAMVALGLPVPPGFIVPTTACLDYFASGWDVELERAVRDGVTELERASGCRLGDPHQPLLVSVRSGAAVSMPGMMDTILDVGMTDDVATGLAQSTGSADFAADTHRRAVESLDSIGVTVATDPIDQILASIRAVFDSWNSDRAVTYRRVEGIAAGLGTAAIVQIMVFGNRDGNSGTGVAFSRHPATGEPGLMGDVLVNAQGEDVVAGTHQTRPLSDMAALWPDAWRQLNQAAGTLEHHFADMVDIEFTVERGELFLLQCRRAKRSPRAVFATAVEMATDPTFPVDRAEAVGRCRDLLADPPTESVPTQEREATVVAEGLGASPGRASGALVVDIDDAVERSARGESVILVRHETSPADVSGIAAAAGLVTTLGGLVSHAAVVARSWGLPAVVGVEGMDLGTDAVTAGGRCIEVGEIVTVDGSTGSVLLGAHVGANRPIPEVAVVEAWTRTGEAEGPVAGEVQPTTADLGAVVTADDCLRVVCLKGYTDADAVSTALLAPVDEVRPVLQKLEAEGLVTEARGGRVRAADSGRARVDDIYAAERAGNESHFTDVLAGFDGPNLRFKELMVTWQVRMVDGDEVPNDHSDPDYDAQVLDLINSRVHGGILDLIERAATALTRLATYRHRLDIALDRARGGDHRYVAHPLLDSYHTVWFELHEELLCLADRDRGVEAV